MEKISGTNGAEKGGGTNELVCSAEWLFVVMGNMLNVCMRMMYTHVCVCVVSDGGVTESAQRRAGKNRTTQRDTWDGHTHA